VAGQAKADAPFRTPQYHHAAPCEAPDPVAPPKTFSTWDILGT
jgi:hypothetical protein